jgi:hypothetical protein
LDDFSALVRAKTLNREVREEKAAKNAEKNSFLCDLRGFSFAIFAVKSSSEPALLIVGQ